MNIVVNDLLVSYQLAGKGKLVVLLHGWGDSARGFGRSQTELAKRYRVLVPDLPGFGNSQAPATVWDLDNYAAFIRDLLQKLDMGEMYAIIGHSNGGAIAIRAIATGALGPKKLVLLAAAGIRTSQPARRLILKIIAKVGNAATIWMPERQRQNLRKQLYGVAGSDLLVVEHMQETFKKTVRQDVQADAANITIPTLLIYAADDKAVPIADGRTYNDLIPKSKLVIVNNAGHFVHLDQPEQVTTLIQEFLA